MRLPRGIRNAGTLLSGNVAAQGIAFAAYLLLGRLFTPADFGVYNIFYSYIEVLIILSTCKYEMAIVVMPDGRTAAQMSRMALRLNAVVSGVLAAVALIAAAGATWWPMGGGLPIPPLMLLLIPAMVYLCGTSRVYHFLGVRAGLFKRLAGEQVVTSVAGTVLKVAAGVLQPMVRWLSAYGLPLGTVLGRAAGNVYLRSQTSHLLKPCPKMPARVWRLALARRYRQYPLYVMPKEFVNSLSANLPFLWLGLYFDEAVIGLFGLAVTFLQRPVLMVANAVEGAFYNDSADRVRNRQPLSRHLRGTTAGLLAVAVPVAVAGWLWAEPVLTFLLGGQWVGTGYYVRCLLPWLVVRLAANSLSFVSNLFERQRVDFWMQVVLLVLRAGALAVGVALHDFRLAVLLFAAVSTVVQTVQAAWYLWLAEKYDRKLSDENRNS